MNPPQLTNNGTDILTYGGLLHRITNRIRQSLELKEILSAAVVEIRSLLQTDRVKVYRFHPDGSGQVIAEAIAPHRLPSLLGLNFPAGDIPPQAREMYSKARQRSIVDVAAQRIILSRIDPPPMIGDLIVPDIHHQPLGDIFQREVDPCHVNYLTAMGVMSSLVVPIFHHQHLWGLLASHHAEPRGFREKELQLFQLVADQLSIAITQSQLLSQTRSQVEQETLINQITPLLHSPRPIPEILQLVLERIVRVVQGSGGRLYLTPTNTPTNKHFPTLYTYGYQPILCDPETPDWLEQQSFWQDLIKSEGLHFDLEDRANLQTITDLYQNPKLASLTPVFQDTPIRGMLIMPLQYSDQTLGCLTIFRNAINTEILWAGYWDKDERYDQPRKSFELWREEKRNQAPVWTTEDMDLIQSLGIHLGMALMKNQLDQLEMDNLELDMARAVAEEANRLKSNFLATTSHELRTPLASTLNCLQILKKGLYKTEDDLKKYIQLAEQSTKNIVTIINDVLDIAKIEAGRMSVDLEPVNLKPILEEQYDLFNLESQRKGIKFVIDCQSDRVYADKGKLRQVLTNLLSNAFKFTDQGEVCIQIIKSTTQPIVKIIVRDSGIGIEIGQQQRLLEPFVQEDGSIKRRYGGTGLGLAICKRFVELMGGQIQLQSSGKNQGTTVTITLPYPPQ